MLRCFFQERTVGTNQPNHDTLNLVLHGKPLTDEPDDGAELAKKTSDKKD